MFFSYNNAILGIVTELIAMLLTGESISSSFSDRR